MQPFKESYHASSCVWDYKPISEWYLGSLSFEKVSSENYFSLI